MIWQIISSTWCLYFFRSSLFQNGPELIASSEVVNAWILSCYATLLKGNGGGGRGRRRVSRSRAISNDLKHLFPLFLRNGHGKGWLNLKHIGEGLQVSLLPSFKNRSRTNPLQLSESQVPSASPAHSRTADSGVSRALWAEACTGTSSSGKSMLPGQHSPATSRSDLSPI